MVLTLLIYCVASLIVIPLAAAVADSVPARYQPLAVACVVCIGLTPSFAPATIALVMVPFGLLVALGLFSGDVGELGALVGVFWIWHLIAFPTTFFATYAIVRILQRDRIRGESL